MMEVNLSFFNDLDSLKFSENTESKSAIGHFPVVNVIKFNIFWKCVIYAIHLKYVHLSPGP